MADLSLDSLKVGGKAALSRALALIEREPESARVVDLLSAAYDAAVGHVIGMTGPPGVGKSSLMNSLVAAWRASGRTVGVIAVDPSSRRSGGALLGDRLHLATDPEDQGVFVRSMAARDRLGGLAEITVAAMVLMRALFDKVAIETVGVGQSETDVAAVADTVLFCVQPGSGDMLQFMKAGIAEIPHIVAVTKADTGTPAVRAKVDVESAFNVDGGRNVAVLLVSARDNTGIDKLVAAIDAHGAAVDRRGVRQAQAAAWLEAAVRERFGRDGVRRAGALTLAAGQSPFRRLAEVTRELTR
jgi:LAO/AO transport system kinase